MELPTRKPTRLRGYDYSTPGAYFVTICTHNRKCILSNIIVGEGLCALPKNILTPIGEEIEKTIQYINDNYKGVEINKYVIMPNHIHLIVILDGSGRDGTLTGGDGTLTGGDGTLSGGGGTPPLQNVIGQLKSYTTNKFGNTLWQRSYHDHIIRDDKDYEKIWEYIDTNVLRWEKDTLYNSERP